VEQALQMSVQPDARVPLQEVTIAGLQQGMHAGNHTCSSIVNAYLQVTVRSHACSCTVHKLCMNAARFVS
jgi:hypothetical protein